MPRAIWKGAISFGLVHVPVSLYPASSQSGIDFDWLDKRSMDPVGYKRINKRTGREIEMDNIVKGVKVDGGEYVVLSDAEIKAAYPKTTQTIEIESFVKASEIPITFFEKPYFLEPLPKGEKVYALLREAMLAQGVVGIARVVMHTKEHLAALMPTEEALMLITLRWASDIRSAENIKLPAKGSKSLKEGDLKMARQLIGDMTTEWDPEQYGDKFSDAINALIAKRVKAGQTEEVEPMEASAPTASNVIDLTELLAKSLGRKSSGSKDTGSKPAAAKPAAAKRTRSRKSTTRKTPARKRA